MGKNTTFHIHVKSEPGYSPKYPEHVFSVVGFSMRRHGFDHKLRKITNCDGSVAICDCRNLWRFITQLLRLMSIVPGVYSRVQKTSSHRQQTLPRKFPWYIVYGHYNWYTYGKMYQWTNTRMDKNVSFNIHVKSEPGYSPCTQNTFSVLLDSVCAATALITNCDKSQIATVVSQFVTVAICDGSKYNFSDWCQLCQKVNS